MDILTLAEAAKTLKLDQKTIRKIVRAGRLPVLEGCRDYRIRLEDLNRLFQPMDGGKKKEGGINGRP